MTDKIGVYGTINRRLRKDGEFIVRVSKRYKGSLEVHIHFSQMESLSSSSSHLQRSPLNGGILSMSIPPVFPVANVRMPAMVADEREVPLRKLCLSPGIVVNTFVAGALTRAFEAISELG